MIDDDIDFELTALAKKMLLIKNNPPRMCDWKAIDAWITAINACINEVLHLKNQLATRVNEANLPTRK